MKTEIHDDSALVETRLSWESVKHFSCGAVCRTVTYLITVRDGD